MKIQALVVLKGEYHFFATIHNFASINCCQDSLLILKISLSETVNKLWSVNEYFYLVILVILTLLGYFRLIFDRSKSSVFLPDLSFRPNRSLDRDRPTFLIIRFIFNNFYISSSCYWVAPTLFYLFFIPFRKINSPFKLASEKILKI